MDLTTVIYSLEASFDNDVVVVNASRKVSFSIEIQNTGGLIDNVNAAAKG